jgi:two-component system sensor histidine kinase MprB
VTLAFPEQLLATPPGYSQIVSASGDVMLAAGEQDPLPVDADTLAVAAGHREAFFEDVHVGGTHLRIFTSQVAPGRAIEVARSLEEVDDAVRNLALVLILVSAGGVALAALLGLIVARAALAPVASLTETAEHVAATRDLSQRIESGRPDELGRLAASFNRMLEALQRSVDAQRELVADASHELRTPLTSLRTNMDVLRRGDELSPGDRERLLGDVTAQLDELASLVNGLIDLAREEEQGAAATEEVRLDLLANEAVERARRRNGTHEFTTELAECTVQGSRGRLARALDNLLDNAAKWSPPGGRIEVAVRRDGEVSVSDEGPGIAPQDRERVFDRFYRAPAARGKPGSGLGLAIVAQTAAAHGGTASVGESSGGGAALRLRLPVISPSGSSSSALS